MELLPSVLLGHRVSFKVHWLQYFINVIQLYESAAENNIFQNISRKKY